MRLTLVERQEARLRCVPDLGVAYLLGQCKQEGVDASLVQGSPKTLGCLLDDSVFPMFAKGYKGVVKEHGESWFREFLKFNHGIATSDEISDKTDPEAMSDLWGLVTFMRDKVWPKWLPQHLFSEIERTKPDVVGFSVWDFYSHPALTGALKSVIDRLRQESDVRVLVGGPGTVTPTARRDLMRLLEPDYIVHHEGEHALIWLLEKLEANRVEEAPNLTFKGYDGETAPVRNLDSLALPDFSQYDLDSFFLPVRVLPFMTARGCNWARCAFCNHHATYLGYRELSADRVRETVDLYRKRYKTEMMMLHDETLTSRRARGLVDVLPDAYYYSYAYPKGYDKDLLKRMYRKGFRVLVWGVESACQEVLNSMRKGTDIKEVEQIIRDTHSAGITNVCFIMFGFPGETRAQAEQTVEFLKRNAQFIERHATTSFRLEEGSPVWREPERWGVKRLKDGDFKADKGMRRAEVEKFLRDLNRRRVRTAAETKYYMPGDSEFRPYFFMQVVYGEGSGRYPVRNGILRGNEVWPSLLMKDVSRPKLVLDKRQTALYKKCDGRHKVNAAEFEQYPYIVRYSLPFKG